MKWFWIVLGLCAALVLGCDEGAVVLDRDEPTRTPVERNLPPDEFDAPIPRSIRARVQQHPKRAEPVCERACARAQAEVKRVGPADTPWGWECVCIRSG